MDFPPITAPSSTLTALHAYSRILGGIRAAGTEPHPRWWHGSLQIVDSGLTTGTFHVAGRPASLTLEPGSAIITGEGPGGPVQAELSGPAATVGREVLRQLGGRIDVDPERWNLIEVAGYEPSDAAAYHDALRAVDAALTSLRSSVSGDISPVQLWPHHFDVSFEWFSDAVEVYEEEGGPKEYNKQIGFGFSPGDEGDPDPYFYANPWPFDESFRAIELPGPARWHGEGWSGGFLPYSAVVQGGLDLLGEFMRTVFDETHEPLS